MRRISYYTGIITTLIGVVMVLSDNLWSVPVGFTAWALLLWGYDH